MCFFLKARFGFYNIFFFQTKTWFKVFFFLISRYWEWWFEHVHPYFQLTNLEYVLYENIEHKTYLESYDDIDFRRKDPSIIQVTVKVFISFV